MLAVERRTSALPLWLALWRQSFSQPCEEGHANSGANKRCACHRTCQEGQDEAKSLLLQNLGAAPTALPTSFDHGVHTSPT
eukprot:COSAG06_NODE_62410_length_265_cov_0.620482_1_plen_80_part_01